MTRRSFFRRAAVVVISVMAVVYAPGIAKASSLHWVYVEDPSDRLVGRFIQYATFFETHPDGRRVLVAFTSKAVACAVMSSPSTGQASLAELLPSAPTGAWRSSDRVIYE